MNRRHRIHHELALVIAGALLVASSSATASPASEGWIPAPATPIQFAIGPPGLQIFHKETPVYGVRFSLLYGNQSKVYGLDSGLFSDAYSLKGIQVGLGNQVFGKLQGAQVGLANSADKGAGVQIGLLNRSHKMKGIQIGLINWHDEGFLPFFPFFNFHF